MKALLGKPPGKSNHGDPVSFGAATKPTRAQVRAPNDTQRLSRRALNV
ncbi:hypothetical protein [Mycobacterium sp. UM_CSW]|nr:hypothetical protein [Mycobacterium sp. UM_CSW]